jgi:hypothetical protein
LVGALRFKGRGMIMPVERGSMTRQMKRMVVIVVRGLAGIAAVVFLLCPLSTGMLLLTFAASIAVFLICQIVLGSLDETFVDQNTPTGYWPPKPIDWRALPESHEDRGNHVSDDPDVNARH